MVHFPQLLEKEIVKFQRLILKSVLHVPNIACNLLSINKLTKDMNCVAKFFNSHCEFQDLCSEKMIGSAKECDGLYILNEHLSTENKQAHTSLRDSISGFEDKIMLWHNRLGNLSCVPKEIVSFIIYQ